MEKHVTATQAVRSFSELLNRIKFNGERFIIERSGKPIAQMQPVQATKETKFLKDLAVLLAQLPHLGEEVDAFAFDLDTFSLNQPPLLEEPEWE